MSMLGCRPLSDAEFARVINAFTGTFATRNRALFVLGCCSGFRISELLSLRLKDVAPGGKLLGRIKVPRKNMKKKRTSRTAVLAPMARPFLQAWLDEMAAGSRAAASTALFGSRNGAVKAISRIQAHRILRDAYARALIFGPDGTLSTHTMRKTFAAKMWDYYGDIFAVQHALGHRSPASTVAYLSFNDQEQVAAVEAVWPDEPKTA